MLISSGDNLVQYSMTPNGSLIEHHKIGTGCGFVRSTNDPGKFLGWLIQREVNHDIETRRRKVLIRFLKSYWTIGTEDSRAGHFNEKLYFQIIKAKIANGALEY